VASKGYVFFLYAFSILEITICSDRWDWCTVVNWVGCHSPTVQAKTMLVA